MNGRKERECDIGLLSAELEGYRVVKSPLFPDFSLTEIFSEASACKFVKYGPRRQVILIESASGDFFIKRTTPFRSKERIRYLFFPRRRWAEWRNLHKLYKARVPAALPVLKGERGKGGSGIFFLMTKRLQGRMLTPDTPERARRLGQYVAFLHSKGVYHRDLHPENILVNNQGELYLIDAQEIFFLPLLPRWLRLWNLGKLVSHLGSGTWEESLMAAFISGYNQDLKRPLTGSEILARADRHQRIHYRSRTKRCLKDSSHFVVVRGKGFKGYKRREFTWGKEELHEALRRGSVLKEGRVVVFKGTSIKVNPGHLFHRDRALASWKASRALEVRGISVPKAFAYFHMDGNSYFVSEYLGESSLLNEYLSLIQEEKEKRRALRKLALWVRKIHYHRIWQRDFKSSNILCRNGEYLMVDLDAIRLSRRLPENGKIVNLAQLNASLSNAVTLKDRLRFYYYYIGSERPSRKKRREIYERIWRITKTKTTQNFGLDLDRLGI